MKIYPIRKLFLALSSALLAITFASPGQEFLLFDDTFTWTETTGGGGCQGFHFWYDKGESVSDNWKSPYDYQNGTFYFRYEILNQPQTSPGVYQSFKLNFCIWCDNTGGVWKESCSGKHSFTGPNVYTFTEYPSTWWNHPNGGIDWTRMDLLWRFGNPFWYNDAARVAYPEACARSDGGDLWETYWNQRDKFWPLEMRMTIVAVAKDHSFSGWDNYISGGSTRQPVPSYSIDYVNEQTNAVVPSTDEYSYNSNMSGAVSGNGQKLTLTPGTNVYFRTKASGELLASNVQTLTVPARPAAPTFTLDLVNNRTGETVSNAYEYSNNADMSGATTGNGTYVSIPAGSTKYFRKKATTGAFKSQIQTLNASTQPNTQWEFVILNDTIDYPNTTDNNGFYFFYHNSSMPVNWASPYDFYNGQVYMRYEIISQVSSEPVGLQFGIWQKLPPVTGTLYETMSAQTTMNGPGSVKTVNSSPNTWWKLDGNNIDWTQMDKVWHFGINPWQMTPSVKQIRSEETEVWNSRFTKWFPMKVYVIVVAVANGHTFSGWDQYLSSPMPSPTYSIDYMNELTNQVVPSTDEYSYSSNMAGAVSGNGQKLTLTPGQDLYFRTKAQGNHGASATFHLDVPARAQAPNFAIDYTNENTLANVSSEYEYSSQENFTSANSGTGSKIGLTPGSTLYFRKKATASAFRSERQTLVVPSRPAAPQFAIDYANETTTANVSSEYEYSAYENMSSAATGTGNKAEIIPGSSLYIRKKATASAFRSEVQNLTAPSRPAAPAFDIDFVNETTSTQVSSSFEYADNENMTGPVSGNGSFISVIPGTTVYFRKKAGSGSFKSGIQTLVIPARPDIPDFTIDFAAETISQEVTSDYQYSDNQVMRNPVTGNHSKPSVTPGTTLYFQKKASSGSFASDIQTLSIPERPSAPELTIDFVNEKTGEMVPADLEYSFNAGMLSAVDGTGEALSLTPGTDVYFRKKVSSTSFSGEIQWINVPERPALDVAAGPSVSSSFLAGIDFHGSSDDFELNDLELNNCSVEEIADLVIKVTPLSAGELSFYVKPNSITGGNFSSAVFNTIYNPVSSISNSHSGTLRIYPTVTSESIDIALNDEQDLPCSVEIINLVGKIQASALSESLSYRFDVKDFPKGMYVIKVTTRNGEVLSGKFIKE